MKIVTSVWKLLPFNRKVALGFLLVARVGVNALDLIGLAGVGAIAALASSGFSSGQPVEVFGVTWTFSSQASLAGFVVLVVGLFVLKSALTALFLRISTRYLARIEIDFSTRVLQYLFESDVQRVTSRSRAQHNWAIFASSRSASSAVLLATLSLIAESLAALGIIAVMFLIDPKATGFLGFYLLLVAVVLQFFVNRRLLSVTRLAKVNSVRGAEVLIELVELYKELRVAGKVSEFIYRVRSHRENLAKVQADQRYLSGLPRYLIEIALMLGVGLALGVQLLFGGGDYALVSVGVVLAGGVRLVSAILPIQSAVAELKSNVPQSAEALQILGDHRFSTGVNNQAEQKSQFQAEREMAYFEEILMDNVEFGFDGNESAVIRGISMRIEKGAMVALVGASGAGKSTLAELIMGLRHPTGGSISFVERANNGGHTALHSRNRPRVGYVPQRPVIFAGTIAQNVSLELDESHIDMPRVMESLAQAGFDREVDKWLAAPTLIGEGFKNLSGGQIQRLGIARALYGKPQLLVFDEATSALDPEVEREVSDTLNKLRGDVTIIAIAHRLSTVKTADNLFLIEAGKVKAHGSFSQLFANSPQFRNYVELLNLSGQGETV